MSRHATDWAWETDPGSSSLKLILLSMADRADEYNLCYCQHLELRKRAGEIVWYRFEGMGNQ